MLFTAAGLLCLLLHAANALVNTTHLAASQSKSTQASSSSPVSLTSKENTSTLSTDARLLLTTSNSSLLANDTKLTLSTTARLETITQNIWTLNPKDASGNNYTFHQLLSLGLDRSEIAIFGIGPGMFDIDFFQVEMTEEMVSRYKPGPNVDFVVQDCVTDCVPISECIDNYPTLYKRDVITQFGESEELAYISQPKMDAFGNGADMAKVNGRYKYDETSGTGVTIYMVDTGAYQYHEEFVNIRNTWEWAGPNYARDFEGDYPDPVKGDISPFHGTAMLSKIAGKTLGVVKNPFVVIVRMNPNEPYGPVPFLKQIDWILQDWEKKLEAEKENPKGRAPIAFINMSVRFWWTQRTRKYGLSREGKYALSKIADRFNEGITAGLLPITASCNDGGPVDSWPALYKGTVNWDPKGAPFAQPLVPGMVVVGATNDSGQLCEWSQTADFVELTAPGYEVKVASGAGPTSYLPKVNGTSAASATAAAVGTYLAGLASLQNTWFPDTTNFERLTDVRNLLLNLAYPRKLGLAQYPKGVWNGNTDLAAQPPNYEAVCGYVEFGNQKRDGSCAYEPSSSSSVSSSFSFSSTSSVPSPSPPLGQSTSSTTSPTPSSTSQTIWTDATFSNESVVLSLNQTAMISSVGKILTGICPPYAQQHNCSQPSQNSVISDVYSNIDDAVIKGEVNVWVEDSGYTSEARRQALLFLATATMAQTAAKCTMVEWEVGNCPEEEPPDKARREAGGDSPCVAQPPIYMCSYASNVLVMTFEEDNPNHWDYINLFIQFETKANQESICAELAEGLEVDEAMMVLLPELDELWVTIRAELGEAAEICGDVQRAIEFVDDAG